MAPKVRVISTQIRQNNSAGITYVLKRFSNGTGVINTFVKGRGNCYRQTGSNKINCNQNNNNFIFL